MQEVSWFPTLFLQWDFLEIRRLKPAFKGAASGRKENKLRLLRDHLGAQKHNEGLE